MNRKPRLPPAHRGRAARRLTSVAALGRFELPVCEDCGQVQYPVREVCVACLSDRLRWREVARAGTLLARTVLHRTNEPYFEPHLPIAMGSVRLDAGPVAMALLAPGCEPGARVRVRARLDRAGEAVLIAASENDDEGKAMAIPDPNSEIAGKVVFIAGAGSGIGRALAEVFARAGAAEVIAGVSPGLPPLPGTTACALEVADAASVASAAAAHAGRVDLLVNCAGVNAGVRLFEAEAEDAARREMEVNYFGLLAVARAFAPAMKSRGQGTIVNLLTFLSHVNLPTMATYCASQAAAHSLTQALRAELQPCGVRVCGVYPGSVEGPVSRNAESLAQAVIGAVRDGVEDLYPGPAREGYDELREDPKRLERELAARLEQG